MNKVTFLYLVLLQFIILGAAANAQLVEGFETGMPSSAPSALTSYTLSSGSWSMYKCSQSGTKHAGNYGCALASSSTDASYIITPTLNTVGTITYWAKSGSSSIITVYISINGGAWTTAGNSSTTSSYSSNTITLNETSNSVRVKFQNGQGTSMYLDDVTITQVTAPYIRISATSLPSFGMLIAGNNSSSSSYSIDGANLSGSIVVSAPNGFQVSTDNTGFYSSLSLAPVSGVVASTTIYARFSPIAATGVTAGAITNKSTGATAVEVNVDGKAISAEPAKQSSIAVSEVTGNSVKLTLSGGDGANRIIVAKAGTAVTWTPSDGADGTGINSSFAAATDQGNGNKIIYSGSAAVVTVSGLTVNSLYYFASYEYNGDISSSENYLLASPGTASLTTLTVPGLTVSPVSIGFGNVLKDSPSKVKSFTVSGLYLNPAAGNINITAVGDFEVSASNTGEFGKSVDVAYSGSALSSATLYARFRPSVVADNITGTLIVTGGGAPADTIQVYGSGKDFSNFITRGIFVAPDGNDVTATGTYDDPFYSLHKAVAKAVPGDTIWMHGGTYYYNSTVMLTTAATADKPISIIAYPDEKPVMNWSNWKPTTEAVRGSARGIKVDKSAKYWTLKKLEICYAPDNGVKCEGAHTTFDQCIFHHNGDGGLQIGLGKDTLSANPDPENFAAYTRVINCDAYRNADPATDYENADGFSCKLYAGYNNYFYGCRAWENCDDGWDCYQTNYQINIENCWAFHNGDPSDWGFTSFNGDGNGFKLGGNGAPCPITIKNCVAFNCIYGAVCCFNDNNNGSAITLLNCTGWDGGKIFKLQSQAHVLKNCVGFDPKSGAKFVTDFSGSVISTNNSWDLPSVTANYDDFVSTSETDALAPREADGSLPRNGFAKLKPGSDLIDKGIDVGTTYFGSAPDLGAYEFDPTGVAEVKNLKPSSLVLGQNYPNPFNPSTVIKYQVPSTGNVVLKVYDMLGKEVATLVNSVKTAGEYECRFNAASLSSGLYIYTLKAGNTMQTKKMMLLK